LGLEIEISVIGSNSSTNYPTRSKFELVKGTGLVVLAMCCTSVWG